MKGFTLRWGLAVALAGLLAAPVSASAQERGRGRSRRNAGPGRGPGDRRVRGDIKPGQLAPDFTLNLLRTGKDAAKTRPTKTKTVQLSSFRTQKPVVLLFGSYT